MSSSVPGHTPGGDTGPRKRAGFAAIREDVHIHAGAPAVRALLADPRTWRDWLPPAVRAFQADSEGVGFRLTLPGREEAYSLRRDASEDPREIVYRVDEGGVAETLTWALFPEGARECHITAEIAYRPAAGLVGGAMETLMHRPQRIQILRDLLWNLKRGVEHSGSAEAASA